MTWAIRSSVLAAGAAALLSAQAVYAAPVANASSAVDPLVSLSVLSTAQSRGAVCSGATFASQASGTACGIPVSIAAASAAAAAAQDHPPPHTGIGTLPLILGLLVVVGLMAAILSGGGDADGDLSPISPA